MLANVKSRLSRRSIKRNHKLSQAVCENLEARQLLSSVVLPTVSGYSSVVTDIQLNGPFATTDAYVNGGINATTGPFQFESFAIVEFDPNNTTIFPGATQPAAPSNLQLTVINNPDAYNSRTGAAGDPATGSFDVYLLPTYTAPTSLVYQTANAGGLPIGLQGQGGISGVTATNFLLGSFTASSAGAITIPLTLPTTGASNAATVLKTDLGTAAKFELAIVPHTTTSSAQIEGEFEYYNDSGNPTGANGIAADGELNESPLLSYTPTAVGETFSMPYGTSTATAIQVNQDNVSGVVEIDVLRNGYSNDTATVVYATSDGTGTAGTNYTETDGTLTFAPGQNDAVISVPVTNTGLAADATFKVTLSSPASSTGVASTIGTSAGLANVNIVGTTNESDSIGGTTLDNNNSASFVLSTSGGNAQVATEASETFATVDGSVTNGQGDFESQAYEVLSFNASAAQSGLSVTSLGSISIELDNDVDTNPTEPEDTFLDGTTIPSPDPTHAGNFNVYLLETSAGTVPTSALTYVGQDPTVGGLNGTAGAVLLGTGSFSDQPTKNSPTEGDSLDFPVGVQDTYTFELSPAVQTFLANALNAEGNSFAPIRIAITPGSTGFAALWANNNSTTGGNFGIQPYVWFNGNTVNAPVPAENFAVNYSNISVNSNESVVAVDIVRSGNAFAGDQATVDFSLTSGSAVLGTDFSAPTSSFVTFNAGQTVATALIPIIPNSSDTSEKNFTITLTSATTTGSEPAATFVATPTTVTITPALPTTNPAVADNNVAAETGSVFTGFAYLNGSVTNGTGSFAFQGASVLEFPASDFIKPGQQVTSLSDLSLGLSNYESIFLDPGTNYAGPPGNFTMYVIGDPEFAGEAFATSSSDPDRYNANAIDGVGGFSVAGGGAGPLSPSTTLVNIGSPTHPDYAIPIGVASFNSEIGLDYFTPTQAALNQIYSVPGVGTFSALQIIEAQINAGEAVRLVAAPGNSAFHMYNYGSNQGASGSGGPNAPQLLVQDTVATTETAESVAFSSPTFSVDSNNGLTTSVTVPVVRSLVEGGSFGDTLTVSFTTTDGNALAGTNYTTESGTLTFLPGVTTQTITIPIADAAINGAKAFTITLSGPATSDTAHTQYVAPSLGANSTATVFITDNVYNNAQTLTQYDSSVGDIGTNGPVTFGGSSLNPAPPINFSIFGGGAGHYAALDFNDSSVINFNNPSEFNGPTGPIQPTGPTNNLGPTYPTDTGEVVYSPSADGSIYNSSIDAINEITLNFVNYYQSLGPMPLNVYLVADATSNILPGVAGTSKNPHYYDTSTTPDGNGFVGAPDGVGNQFGAVSLLGTVTVPANFTYQYVDVPLTSFSAAAEATLVNDLNATTKFRIIVAPETTNTAPGADWIYGYTVVNPSYSQSSGNPLNYYIQPELSFDVSYGAGTDESPLPSYITPSANADYVWDSSTGNLTLTNGSLTFAVNSAISGDTTDPAVNLTATGPTASVIFNTSETIAGLTLAGGATATITNGANATVTTNLLSLDATSKLDITTNKVIVNYGSGTDPATTIVPELSTGFHNNWTSATGVTSSAAAANPAKFEIGYLDGANAVDRQAGTVTTGQFEFAFGLNGDAFLQASVGFSDLVSVAENFGKTGEDFAEGNYNYDPSGSVGFADLVDVAENFGGSAGAHASAPTTGAAPIASLSPSDGATASAITTPASSTPSTSTAKTGGVVINPTPTTASSSSASSDSGNGVVDSVLGDDGGNLLD